jgi:uncharacterized Zn-binding protein involved in type VI secretion
MYKITRVGDQATHGAVVITGDSTRIVNDAKIARIGDLVSCPRHGVNKIIAQAATIVDTTDSHTAHIVSTTECGAQIITGSSDVLIDGSTTSSNG